MIFEIIVFLVFSIIMSMVGMGGGILYVPLLLFLGYGFQDASTLSLFLITITGLSAFGRFRKAKLVDWQLALVMELFTGLGAFTGGFTSVHFNELYLKVAFGVALMIAAYFMFRSHNEPKRNISIKTGRFYWHRKFGGNEYSINILQVIPVMFLIGYVAGLLGIAGGA
ncbi:MAG: sulfite exporter TauE/SafE family protein, partial [Chlorobi bacterium]|nr:sulfite exporter TauE/SafE family protein [Chlorobiota bacterium]